MGVRAWLVTIAPLLGLVALLLLFAHEPWSGQRLVGASLGLVGFSLVTAARLRLKDSFSVAPRATVLVQTGLYSRIRHPIYVFSALGIVGLILYVDELRLLMVVPVVVLVQLS